MGRSGLDHGPIYAMCRHTRTIDLDMAGRIRRLPSCQDQLRQDRLRQDRLRQDRLRQDRLRLAGADATALMRSRAGG